MEHRIQNYSIFELFAKVKGKVLHPKLKYIAPDGKSKIVFHVAGAKSRYNGQIMITDGKGYGENIYYGRIEQDQKQAHSIIHFSRDAASAASTITAIVNDPVNCAKMQGQKYSYCVFCGTLIRNKNSLAVGYGPICADNYGLPWEGEGAAKARKEELEQALEDKENM